MLMDAEPRVERDLEFMRLKCCHYTNPQYKAQTLLPQRHYTGVVFTTPKTFSTTVDRHFTACTTCDAAVCPLLAKNGITLDN